MLSAAGKVVLINSISCQKSSCRPRLPSVDAAPCASVVDGGEALPLRAPLAIVPMGARAPRMECVR
jgi:hypothetical protein